MTLPRNKTKIVCTIGPASESPEVMEKMIRAGMNIARLNFSHSDFDSRRAVVRNLRSAARSLSLFRLPAWIIGISSSETTCQGLVFSSGVYPVFNEDHPKDYTPFVRIWIKEHEIQGDIAVLTEGPSSKQPEANHRMEIIELGREQGRG